MVTPTPTKSSSVCLPFFLYLRLHRHPTLTDQTVHGTGTNVTTGLSFTSKKSTPTGFQDLYVIENSVSPVSLTVPHSASLPEGASTTGFSANAQGYLTHNGKNYFGVEGYGANPEKTVYWVGGHSSTQRVANLWVKECRGC